MTSIDALHKRIDTMLIAIEQRKQPKPVIHLPTVWLAENGEDLPGYAESNAQAYRQAALMGIAVKEYMGIDPDESGSEAA